MNGHAVGTWGGVVQNVGMRWAYGPYAARRKQEACPPQTTHATAAVIFSTGHV